MVFVNILFLKHPNKNSKNSNLDFAKFMKNVTKFHTPAGLRKRGGGQKIILTSPIFQGGGLTSCPPSCIRAFFTCCTGSDENFVHYFIKTKANNKYFIVVKYECKGYRKA